MGERMGFGKDVANKSPFEDLLAKEITKDLDEIRKEGEDLMKKKNTKNQDAMAQFFQS